MTVVERMMSNDILIPSSLPLLLLKDGVLLPGASINVTVTDRKNMSMIREHLWNRSTIRSSIIGVLPHTRLMESEEKGNDDGEVLKQSIGVAALVVRVAGTNWPRPAFSLVVSGICRFRVMEIIQESPYFISKVLQLDRLSDDVDDDTGDNAALAAQLRSKALELLDMLSLSIPATTRLKKLLDELPGQSLSDLVASILKGTSEEKIIVLDTVNVTERMKRILPMLLKQIEALKLAEEKNKKNKVFSWNRNFRLRPGVSNDNNEETEQDDMKSLEKKLQIAEMPEKAHKVAMRELRRLKRSTPMMPEHAMLKTYLELMAELPWSKMSVETPCIVKARKDLDLAHFGLQKVKKRILEYLAVKQLRNSLKGPILCFVGPPGVGKTSIGKAIANTLSRSFHRISLGGVCDQSDIRGHRRTYIGSMPGRIIEGLKTVGVRNPVFLLDEVDKLSAGVHGDPAAALLEVLDPEQNHTFTDHYLNVPFDLSQVLFLATANNAGAIPPALLDRMEVISISGYTQEEKVEIACRHLLPKQLTENGLSSSVMRVPNESLKTVIRKYTREAGVRSLERKLGALCRSVAVRIAESQDSKGTPASGNPPEFPILLDDSAVEDILGPAAFDREILRLGYPGVAVGLAWTPVGGEVLVVEASRMEGDGRLTLTGQLGDVMKESATIAINWVRAHAREYGIQYRAGSDLLESTDLHIHFPAGAVEKDGPSAGITIVTAVVSLFTGRSVLPDVAMTGEITLTGLVLPVGGVKEKVLAAHRAGIRRIVIPRMNEKSLADLPDSVKDDIQFLTVDAVDDVLQAVFEGGFPRPKLISKL